jgi:hypothetical protein
MGGLEPPQVPDGDPARWWTPHFGAVMDDADVCVNGHLVGSHWSFLICRIAGVACSHIYALNWMLLAAAAIVNSAFRAAGSAPPAEYSRLALGLPRHGTCEQMAQFCAA